MKNGFTLVELLAVIVILAILSAIVVFSVGPTIDSSKTNLSSIQIKQVEQAARMYYLKEGMNYINYDKDSTKLCISLEYLVDNGYFEETEVLDLETNEQIGGSVLITSNSNKYNYQYQEKSCYLNQYILDLYKPNNTVDNNEITYPIDTVNKLIDDRKGGTIESGGNIRYYGSNPNNYIDIGDRDADGNVILWRIIGLFNDVTLSDNTNANLIKLVRDTSIGEYSWNFKSDGTTSTDWSSSSLNNLLNSAYYNSTSTSYYNQSTTAITVDFTSTGLSNSVQNKIESIVWNVGGIVNTNIYADDAFENEQASTWDGKIALIGLSDYAYATINDSCTGTIQNISQSTCHSNFWLTKSFVYSFINYIGADEIIYCESTLNNAEPTIPYNVLPSFYLKSNVEFLTGSGSLDDPIIVH